MTFPTPIQPPSDGFDRLEQEFLKDMIIDIYKVIPKVEDKFILFAVEEMGYPQEVIGEILGIPQYTICLRLQKIKKFLKNHPLMVDMK